MYGYVHIPHLTNGFVIRCNMCNIMCDVLASTFFLCHNTLALQKGHHEASVLHPIFQKISPYLAFDGNTKFCFCVFWIFLLALHATLGG